MMFYGILVLDKPSDDPADIAASLMPPGCEVQVHLQDAARLHLVGDCPVDLLVLERDREDGASLGVRAVVAYEGQAHGPTIHVGGYARWPSIAPDRIARIHTLLGCLPPDPVRSTAPFRLGDLLVDFDTRRVYRGNDEVSLRHREFEVLAYLATRAGKWRSVEQILDAVWGDKQTPASAASLWTHVRRLRTKIEPDPQEPARLLSRPGLGYCVPASDAGLVQEAAAGYG